MAARRGRGAVLARIVLWTIGVLVVLTLVVVLAFRFSPWPSVALIQMAFSEGDKASEARLAKHVPAGIVTEADLAYGPGPDDRFDINFPDSTGVARPTVVWVHGGGFIAGTKEGIANYLKVLAGEGFATVGIEYSTGYGTRYPTPVEQVNAALGHLVANASSLNIDPERLVLAGDSAGAQISSQVALLLTDPDYAGRLGIAPAVTPERLRGIVLVSGAFDIAEVRTDGPYGWFMQTVLWAYSGARDFMNDPRFVLASIPQQVTAAFPPAFISSGNGDPLAPQAERLAARLTELSVPVDTLFFPADHTPTLPHEYQFNLDTKAGADSFTRLKAFLNRVLGVE